MASQSSQQSVLSKWISEYCSPVVITTATAEAESMCLRNGLLFHELLSAFGRLDELNAYIRCGNQMYPVTDAHIRFERGTEVKARGIDVIDKLLKDRFEEFDISRLPSSAAELKAAQPTAWTQQIEQIVVRSMAFSEYETLSHPYMYLAVVATTDVDPVACMQELASSHHTPACMSSGQYDPNMVQRVFVLLHDANHNISSSSSSSSIDPNDILRRLKSSFPSESVRMLVINSFPMEAPNFQQPDMWSKFLIPRFFPGSIPQLEAAAAVNPRTGQPAIGSLLTVEDFMTLRDFCVSLYTQSIIPNMERRLALLHKQVNDARKGVRNVLKSFWRKPRDETDNSRGGLKYRYDKIEAQILLLADTAFIMKDFETAISMYKLARDDFKADKCVLHYAHSCLMMAASQVLLDPSKAKDIHHHLEALTAALPGCNEFPHCAAYFSLLAAEMFVVNYSTRAPLQSAQVLLQGAASLATRSPILSGLLVERAAGFFLQANQARRYVFQIVIAGNRLHKCGLRPARHAAVCFAASMLLLDKGSWGDLKAKLSRALAGDLKFLGREGAQRSLLLMLKMLSATVCEGNDQSKTAAAALTDAVNVYREVTSEGAWGSIIVNDGWRECTTREVLLEPLPITPATFGGSSGDDGLKLHTEVVGLQIPQLDASCTALVQTLNGDDVSVLLADVSAAEQQIADDMRRFLELEIEFMERFVSLTAAADASAANNFRSSSNGEVIAGAQVEELDETLADKWAQLDVEMARLKNGGGGSSFSRSATGSKVMRIPLGEDVKVRLRLHHKLPIDLHLTKVKLCPCSDAPTSSKNNNADSSVAATADANAAAVVAGTITGLSDHHSESIEQSFAMEDIELLVAPDVANELVLRASPRRTGRYRIDGVRWHLSEHFSVKQSLRRDGPLLQKTLQQRANRERGKDKSLSFEVVEEHPNLRLKFEGLSPEVLQGQLLKSTLVLRNEGAATACDIFIKLSQPAFVFYLSGMAAKGTAGTTASADRWIKFYGGSSTVMSLSGGTSIAPGAELRFEAWLGLSQLGMQKVSLLASYKALRENGAREPFGPGNRCRTSFISIQTKVLPSVGLALRLVPRSSSPSLYSLLMEVSNFLQPIQSDEDGHFDSNSNALQAAIDGSMRERRSSVGQLELELPRLSESGFSEIEENSIKVMGMWMLGAANPMIPKKNGENVSSGGGGSSYGSSSAVAASAVAPALLAAPMERVAHCFTVRMKTESSNKKAKCSWLLPLPEQETAAPVAQSLPTATLSNEHIMQVVEQFLCIANARRHFEREVESSRQLVQAEELEAEAHGPRSIAQVRRDKQMQLQKQHAESGGSSSSMCGSVGMQTVSAHSEQLRMLSLTTAGIRDVAQMEADKFGVAVAFIWMCRWEGKLRWGLHSAPGLSFFGDKRSVSVGDCSSNSSNQLTKVAVAAGGLLKQQPPSKPADCLLVSFKHVSTLQLCPTRETGVHLPITVCLTSLASEDLLVSVVAVDYNTNPSQLLAAAQGSLLSPRLSPVVAVSGVTPRTSSISPERRLSGTTAASAPNLLLRESIALSASEADKALLVEADYSIACNQDVAASLGLSSSSNSRHSSSAAALSHFSAVPVEKAAHLGLRWNGKTQHAGITVSPGECRQLQLAAFVSKPGVYDLNRFCISVRFASGHGPLQLKKITGQSLIDVILVD